MQANKNDQDVYKMTGFAEIIESPVFYLILVLTFVLGISSIFGFLQNPRKLKSVVDVINTKVADYDSNYTANKSQQVNLNRYSVLFNLNETPLESDLKIDESRYSIFSDELTLKELPQSEIRVASFDYDITSKQFWRDLQVDSQDPEAYPLSLDGQYLVPNLENDIYLDEGDSNYSVKVNINRG